MIENLLTGIGFGSTEFHVIRPNQALDKKYLFYLTISEFFRNAGRIEMTGAAGQKRVPTEFIKNFPVPLSPLEEQQAIARFLDNQTRKIDDLIEAKRKLLDLLKEKRQAIITHAVTKGIDPDVKMKPSGIEWLGDVPEHWEVMSLKYCLKYKGGAIKTGPFGSQLTSADMLGGSIKVYNQRNVLNEDFSLGDNYINEDKYLEMSSFKIYAGDLLITTRGTIGHCAIVPEEAEKGILHPCLMRIQVDQKKVLPNYLKLLIQDSGFVLGQLRIMSNATTIDVIYSQTLKQVSLLVPPVSEQQAIVQYIDDQIRRIDDITAETQKAIERLTEYRIALISAAVTGKIDVRGRPS